MACHRNKDITTTITTTTTSLEYSLGSYGNEAATWWTCISCRCLNAQ